MSPTVSDEQVSPIIPARRKRRHKTLNSVSNSISEIHNRLFNEAKQKEQRQEALRREEYSRRKQSMMEVLANNNYLIKEMRKPMQKMTLQDIGKM